MITSVKNTHQRCWLELTRTPRLAERDLIPLDLSLLSSPSRSGGSSKGWAPFLQNISNLVLFPICNVFSQGPVRHCPGIDCGTLLLQEEIARMQIRFRNKWWQIFFVECKNKYFGFYMILHFGPEARSKYLFWICTSSRETHFLGWISNFSRQRFDLNRKFFEDLKWILASR